MAKGFDDLRDETLRLLNESDDSVIAELPSGTGSAPTLTNNNGILQYLNEAAFDLCRTCVYLPTTLNVATHTGRTYDFSASALTYPITIHINGTTIPLTRCGENELRSYDLNYTITSGEPTYWYEAGYNNIGFYSVPSTAISFIARGAGLPTAIAEGSGSFSFISDDLLMQALPAYAARKIALKNYDDPSIVGRTFWGDWYDQVRMQLWSKLDPSYKAQNGIFSVPPVMSAGGKQ
jgi:hypothetical protein